MDTLPAPALSFVCAPPPEGFDNGVTLAPVTRDWSGDLESLAFAPVMLLAELLKARRVSSRQLVELCLSRLDAHADRLVCVVSRVDTAIALANADRADAEIASGNYRGVLHGVPFGVKDSFHTKGLPTTDGANRYADRMMGADAVAIERLQNAGAILLAKLSMGELAMDDVWYGGMTRNPWSPETGSSGSSAGSASAVAAGLLPFALAGETWGSIISPAMTCGVVGLRPTWGRLPRSGVSALSWSMDKIGVMARSVADCALVLDVLRGADAGDAASVNAPFTCDFSAPVTGLRLGYDVSGFDAPTENRALFGDAKAEIERLCGVSLVPVYLPELTPALADVSMTIIGVEGAASYAEFIETGGLDELVRQGDDNWPAVFRKAQTVSATTYLHAQQERARLQAEMNAALAGLDAYITPSCVGESLRYTNLCGQPEVVTRCGFGELSGLPVGLSVVGNLWNESAALRVAHAYERATDWHTRTPPGF